MCHSNNLLTNLTSSWTSKPLLEIKYRLDTGALVEQGLKSHFSTLERLLAWEKKLYQEVKAREGGNIEHEEKLLPLQSLEYKGGGEAKLDKTKGIYKEAAVNDFGNITVCVHYFICSEFN